jgi:hypothetical protein
MPICPAPDFIEDILAVHLRRHHHAVRLPLGAHVVVAGVDEIAAGFVLAVDALRRADGEQLTEPFVQTGFDLLLVIAELREQISIYKVSVFP